MQKVTELTMSVSHYQASMESITKDKESLRLEHNSTLQNTQSLETRVLELTNQIVVLVREKESVEEKMRQLQRSYTVLEREKEEKEIKMESLQNQSLIQKGWNKEREVSTLLF